jgi:hypothetical protein
MPCKREDTTGTGNPTFVLNMHVEKPRISVLFCFIALEAHVFVECSTDLPGYIYLRWV